MVVRASGISGLDFEAPEPASAAVEQCCDAVAGAALVPADWLLGEQLVRAKGQVKTWDEEELTALASRFGVSREVIMRPALEDRTSTGGPPHHLAVLSQFGRSGSRSPVMHHTASSGANPSAQPAAR
nr:ImmA/IrrE family metallo-endopeptidase [Mesorhizobium sp. dw_380]